MRVFNYAPIAGLLLFLSGAVILMGIISGEIFYPTGYSTMNNEISDLGATRPPNSVITQPSATIFNITMLLSGLMVLSASFLMYKQKLSRAVMIPTLLLGVGVFGVGVFPGNHAAVHPIFAMTAFVFGGLAAILSFRTITGPFRFVALSLGTITLVSLFFANAFIPAFGDGGVERWVAYPVVLWLCGFGGYLYGKYTNIKGV